MHIFEKKEQEEKDRIEKETLTRLILSISTKSITFINFSWAITLAGTPSEKLRVEIFRIIKLS